MIRREGLPRLADADLATRQGLRRQVRRYEHPHPRTMIHVDIKKLGRIPGGAGHRVLGRSPGRRNSQASRSIALAHGYGSATPP